MIQPQRAPVTPRVLCPETGDAIPLEEAMPPPGQRSRGAIEIVGGPGSGKTTALAHLDAVTWPNEDVLFLDDPGPARAARQSAKRFVVYTSNTPHFSIAAESLYLAPWTEDDLIQYLLAVHPDQCRSVMGRLRGADHRGWLVGVPQLWRIVLDEMACDPGVVDVREPLRRHWRASVADDETDELARRYCLATLIRRAPDVERAYLDLFGRGGDTRRLGLLHHRVVRVLLAADDLARRLAAAAECPMLGQRLPREVVAEASEQVASCPRALDHLHQLVEGGDRTVHAMAASVLHAAASGWRPETSRVPSLVGAHLKGASWAGLDLSKAELGGADLVAADLTEAKLDYAVALGACFRNAVLRRASMNRIAAGGADLAQADLAQANGWGADFAGAHLAHADFEGAKLVNADLRRADLTGTRFRACDLRHAKFLGATIDGADFSEANLRWASFRGMNLQNVVLAGTWMVEVDFTACNLEHVNLPRANFEGAYLRGARLTGSSMPRANLRKARLRGAGLAGVDWEGVDLSEADLRQCSFHLGSSRSGLVDSPRASEGPRTGFEADQRPGRHCRAPERIRKANLRGANLRGARIDGVDFYLVDLRDARCTLDQIDHFRRCGAILYDR